MTGEWIQTHTNRCFSLERPRPEDVDIEDIAFALGNLVRFTGHAGQITIAEHSVMVSRAVAPVNALWGLMHDAAEAYCGDVSRPLKRLLGASYRDIEHRVLAAIAQSVGLEGDIPSEVKDADGRSMMTERDALMPGGPAWNPEHEKIQRFPYCLAPQKLSAAASREVFLCRYTELTGVGGYVPETVLAEAQRIVFGDRQKTYGHPLHDYTQQAALWSALLMHKLKEPMTAHEAALCMVLLKARRSLTSPMHRDSYTDMAGYAEVAARVAGVDA